MGSSALQLTRLLERCAQNQQQRLELLAQWRIPGAVDATAVEVAKSRLGLVNSIEQA